MFQHIEFYPGDPILGLMDKYKADPRSHKVNLGVGVYYDDDGNLPVLECVKTVETRLANPPQPRPYLPMDGLEGYRKACQHLLLGRDHPALQQNRVATVASLGGSGALRVGADFIHQWFPKAKVYVSDPTWGNHISIFAGAGFEVHTYPYYDAETIGIKFDELKTFLQQLDAGSVILLHPCCHNPTGIDPTHSQWDELLDIIKTRQLIPFMDIAYQGFGDDMDTDAYAIRRAVDLGMTVFISNSFSKSLSLYGERVGGLSVVCQTEEEARLVQSQLKFTIRRMYSNPPSHGGHVVSNIMNDESLFQQWQQEVYAMRDRIRSMRQQLQAVLSEKIPDRDFSYFTKQRGMFSFTGLTPAQVNRLQTEFGIYMVENGRMCIAGLNQGNVDYVANAMAEILQ
ncbi:aspartate/tyrosine/aromatic aminotransferase [Neisseriaceae bacterium ESL0693]|nr:aspartate/tyrosine/aromatic aminotransferase [Neisseriaceae bacterium ESL0693]